MIVVSLTFTNGFPGLCFPIQGQRLEKGKREKCVDPITAIDYRKNLTCGSTNDFV